MRDKPTCGYAGCKRPAVYVIQSLTGKRQRRHACEQCAPSWAARGTPPAVAGRVYYTVERIK